MKNKRDIINIQFKDHLESAEKMLSENKNYNLRYIALELRLALEALVYNEIFNEFPDNGKEEDSLYYKFFNEKNKKFFPLRKKINGLQERDHSFNKSTDIFIENIFFGSFKTFEKETFIKIYHDLSRTFLHHMDLPKMCREGNYLGIPNNKWYDNNRLTLNRYLSYLKLYKDNQSYFLYRDIIK
jgi:hypothetical protein